MAIKYETLSFWIFNGAIRSLQIRPGVRRCPLIKQNGQYYNDAPLPVLRHLVREVMHLVYLYLERRWRQAACPNVRSLCLLTNWLKRLSSKLSFLAILQWIFLDYVFFSTLSCFCFEKQSRFAMTLSCII